MQFDDDASLDTSQVQDLRDSTGAGGGDFAGFGVGRLAAGGGGLGIVGLVIYFLFSTVIGGGTHGTSAPPPGLDSLGSGRQVTSGALANECRIGRDANAKRDCEIVAVINSVQAYWTDQFARSGGTYKPAQTRFFRGSVRTGCGSATSDVGPFYCPADSYVYIDLGFFDELRTKFGAEGGPFVDAYVIAHEYGHHVQDLLGTESKVRTRKGPNSDSVRLELQADCYAGAWANHASTTPSAGGGRPLVKEITPDDVARAVDAASRIGDDYIQTHLGNGQNDPSSYTHGTSEQREKWLQTGLSTGSPAACDTFSSRTMN